MGIIRQVWEPKCWQMLMLSKTMVQNEPQKLNSALIFWSPNLPSDLLTSWPPFPHSPLKQATRTQIILSIGEFWTMGPISLKSVMKYKTCLLAFLSIGIRGWIIFYVYVNIAICVPWCMCGAQRTTSGLGPCLHLVWDRISLFFAIAHTKVADLKTYRESLNSTSKLTIESVQMHAVHSFCGFWRFKTRFLCVCGKCFTHWASSPEPLLPAHLKVSHKEIV